MKALPLTALSRLSMKIFKHKNLQAGIMELTNLTGLGHQVKKNAKALRACRESLMQAYKDLIGTDEVLLKHQINKLIVEADERAASAEEAVNQNN
jgi:hypothetical protein